MNSEYLKDKKDGYVLERASAVVQAYAEVKKITLEIDHANREIQNLQSSLPRLTANLLRAQKAVVALMTQGEKND